MELTAEKTRFCSRAIFWMSLVLFLVGMTSSVNFPLSMGALFVLSNIASFLTTRRDKVLRVKEHFTCWLLGSFGGIFVVGSVILPYLDIQCENNIIEVFAMYKPFTWDISFQQFANLIPVRFQVFMLSLSVAHLGEYLFVASYHYEELNWDSFLINQSTAYILAHMIAFNEFLIEYYFTPKLFILTVPEKWFRRVTGLIGLSMIVVGHIFRISAMFTAARNFHHQVQSEKADDHKLVTSGVYSIVRHPSYFGWFYWSLGTQIWLMNPVSYIGFYFAGVHFFKDRIPYEEYCLMHFFGEKYVDYAIRTPIWIPEVQEKSPFKFNCYGFRRRQTKPVNKKE